MMDRNEKTIDPSEVDQMNREIIMLGELGDVHTVGVLAECAGYDNERLKRAALDSLKKIASANPRHPELSKAYPVIRRAFEEAYYKDEMMATMACFGNQAVPDLLSAMYNDSRSMAEARSALVQIAKGCVDSQELESFQGAFEMKVSKIKASHGVKEEREGFWRAVGSVRFSFFVRRNELAAKKDMFLHGSVRPEGSEKRKKEGPRVKSRSR